MRNKKTQELVLLAILTALTLALAFVHVPTPTGFVTLLDVGVFFTAFYLGKKEGAIVGGLSGLLIDFLLGYPQWAFFSLLFHGAQGYFAGWTGKNRLIGVVLASLSMIGGYFVASSFIYNVADAVTSLMSNTLQNTIGLVVGYILAQAIERIGAVNHVIKGN
ncbi:TPA: ECF transporter S component [Streptococcus suis]|uniref:ECF transporter S component n=1 Tax=Streptococcus suis TaxID=1307 RepID=UPI00143253BE|nr:ECF transporter S component [Streptococcus suis]NJW41715.1 ECF transporter S component [Streptococcus suis]HEM2743153.1 ECF transporter S component [Streptococcus suis]HEM2758426.1 ECF transporter S component [Streptococcus suis]HEM2765012.1 ECF transporter S component [Streptococcus suis]HEM3575489.1 ECF transporter S component [Streptococcus suis]